MNETFVFLALEKIKLTSGDAIELIKMLIQFDRSEGEMCFFDFCTQHLHSKFCEHNFRMVINEERANVQLLANAEPNGRFASPVRVVLREVKVSVGRPAEGSHRPACK